MSIEMISIVLSVLGVVLTIVGFINAWMLVGQKNMRDDVTKLREADTALAAQIGAIRELVAGQYITRAEFSAALDRQTTTILAAITGVLAKKE